MDIEKVVGQYIEEYNNRRLHSSIDYVRAVDYYRGNPEEIKKLRIEKLAIAKEGRLAANREFNRILKWEKLLLISNGLFVTPEGGKTMSSFKYLCCVRNLHLVPSPIPNFKITRQYVQYQQKIKAFKIAHFNVSGH